MPAMKCEAVIHPLCYEHHSEMVYRELMVGGVGRMAYACQQSDCFVCYDALKGYFLRNLGHCDPMERCMLPSVRCTSDWFPMYLLEVQPEHPSFRLWRCPNCNRSHRSGDLSHFPHAA
jgi:hypothetical protein